jgi:hypothetical protein
LIQLGDNVERAKLVSPKEKNRWITAMTIRDAATLMQGAAAG